MGVPFKKIARKDPRKADAVAKFYPQLVTLGDNATLDDIAYVMKEKSSLTLGDIQSVLTNFVEAMITTLYSGQSVNIKNFGVFSLSARTAGVLEVFFACRRIYRLNYTRVHKIRNAITFFYNTKLLLQK